MKRRNKLANDRPSRRHWRPRRFFLFLFFHSASLSTWWCCSFYEITHRIPWLIDELTYRLPFHRYWMRNVGFSIDHFDIVEEFGFLLWICFATTCRFIVASGWWRHLRRNAIGWVTPADSATANQNRRVERNGHRRLSTGIVIAGFQNRRKTIEFHQMSLQTRLISVVSAVFLRYLGVST